MQSQILGRSRPKSQDTPATPCLEQQVEAPCIKLLSATSQGWGWGISLRLSRPKALPLGYFSPLISLVHHNAATRNAAMHNAIFSHRNSYLIWIQKGFTAEPLRNDSGANFQRNDSDSGPKVRDTGRKSELQTKSRRYSPESEPNRPEKAPEWGLGASAENPP